MWLEFIRALAVSLAWAGIVPQAAPPRVAPADARKHVGDQITICGRVVSYGCWQNERLTVLDLDDPYWEGAAGLGILSTDRAAFGQYFEDVYLWAPVCATGRVERVKDRFAVMVDRPDAIVAQGSQSGKPRPYPADAVQSCTPDLKTPTLTRHVKPKYTPEAMRQKLQGRVLLDALVRPDGRVGDIRVIRSLDRAAGLDQEAILAITQWRFRPATRNGQPVGAIVQVEMSFTLGK